MGKKFEYLVDEFIKKIRSTNIDSSTEITLTIHWVDIDGNEVYAEPKSMLPLVKVFGPEDATQAFALACFVSEGINNVKRHILDTPDGPITRKAHPYPVYLGDITLEII